MGARASTKKSVHFCATVALSREFSLMSRPSTMSPKRRFVVLKRFKKRAYRETKARWPRKQQPPLPAAAASPRRQDGKVLIRTIRRMLLLLQQRLAACVLYARRPLSHHQ